MADDSRVEKLPVKKTWQCAAPGCENRNKRGVWATHPDRFCSEACHGKQQATDAILERIDSLHALYDPEMQGMARSALEILRREVVGQ